MQDLRSAPTTHPRRSRKPHNVATAFHIALSNRLCKRRAAAFILSMLKTNAAAWCSRRLLSPHTALLATAQRTRCKDATLVGQGFKYCVYEYLINFAYNVYQWPKNKLTPCSKASLISYN